MVVETLNLKKIKICLADYNFQKDMENRLVMAQFTMTDLKVLEEILFSSIRIPLDKLSLATEVGKEELLPILERLAKTGLLTFEEDAILIDKDMRKYYESQTQKFEEDFKPGMEFFQHLLKKVPIHVLPNWYAISRTSNNIFDSIVEKYLYTPQIYQRYLTELSFVDPTPLKIMDLVFTSDDLKVSSKEIKEALNLSNEEFVENMLLLEFSCVLCLCYELCEGCFNEVITPFHEWKEYLLFLKKTEVNPIGNVEDIERELPEDFSFVKDLGLILQMAKKTPIRLTELGLGVYTVEPSFLNEFAKKAQLENKTPAFLGAYFNKLQSKLVMLKLAEVSNGKLHALESADYFLDMKLDARGLFIFRHPNNRLAEFKGFTTPACLEKALRECEKSIVRVLGKGWVFFDEFLKGVTAALNENLAVVLKKTGKTWKYSLPEYTEEDKRFIHTCILEWLFEAGITAKGTLHDRECFTVTAFGLSLFSR